MEFIAYYDIPDLDDLGYHDENSYLFVSSVGYYEVQEPFGVTHRKSGRKDFYLSYNHGGAMKVRTSQGDVQINGGTVFIYKPWEEQYYGQADSNPISNYWVHFTGNGAYHLLKAANLADGNIFYTGVNDEIPAIYDQLLREIIEKKHNHTMVCSSLLMKLIAVISRRVYMNDHKQVKKRILMINESIYFIHRNYFKKITVSELANLVNLSTSRYSALFRELMGVSPQQYIIKFRLKKARELMQYSNLTIGQVAKSVGFDDQFNFSKLFKKYENLTPSQYLSRIQK